MKVKIKEELDRLLSLGILKPVQFSKWATPIVPVLKPDRPVRISGDFKVTINPLAKLDRYAPSYKRPFGNPWRRSIIYETRHESSISTSRIRGITKEVYSYKYTYIGLFEYTRLPFGVSTTHAIFQRVMEGLLQDIPGVVVYIDDFLITCKTNEDHLQSFETLLKRMEDAGMLLKKDKCCFMTKSVSYLGYVIDAEGLHPTEEKLQAIRDAPSPKKLIQLK